MDDKHIQRIHSKLDRLDDRLDEQGSHLVEIKQDLRYHIKRTDILEAQTKQPIALAMFLITVVNILKWTFPLAIAMITAYFTYRSLQ